MLIPLEVSNLEKTYGKGQSNVHAVKGINLKIKKGEVFGFLGPNGAGKTTSLKMMIGILKPTNGEVSIMGMNPNKDSEKIKDIIGIVPQDISIYETLTVEENIWFMAKAYRIPKLAAKERIDNLINLMGLENKRKARGNSLSGGQKRRLNLIMSIIHDPDIVLCDEPTAGLDPQSRIVVWDFIRNLTRVHGKTVILTTHFMEEADRLSDRVAIIDNGKILVLNTPEKLKTSIGEGDFLEITFKEEDTLKNVLKKFKSHNYVESVQQFSNRLILRCLDVIPKIAELLSQIDDPSSIKDLKIRNTSLEDVFISLTGRSLRN